MKIETLKHINETLKEIINYAYGSWDDAIVYPYWVGEYNEVEVDNECGYEENTFILTGTTKGLRIDLENDKDKIKTMFEDYTAALDNVSVAIYYENGFGIPIENMEIKRMQINLTVKEYKYGRTRISK